jgi:hypothetical protein
MKKSWEPMRLRFVGRVSEFMRGQTGSAIDPSHDFPTKHTGSS